MLDKNNKEIKAGDFVKLIGMVQYADGLKEKISKKTWIVGENLELPEVSEGMSLLIVGSEKEGLLPEYAGFQEGMLKIGAGSVPQHYRVLKDVDSQNWKRGEIVRIIGSVSKETLENGFLERVADTVPHQHVMIIAEPVKIVLPINETQNG